MRISDWSSDVCSSDLVRTGRWKLIHFWEMPDEWALYDLKEDPDEMVNLVDDPQHAELVARLTKRITQLRAETGDVDPPGYVPPKLKTGKCAEGRDRKSTRLNHSH